MKPTTLKNTDFALIEPTIAKLAKHVANKINFHPLLSEEDFYQVGIMAALECIPRHDPTQGASLTTWVSIRAKGAMIDECRKLDHLTKSHRRKVNTEESIKITNISLNHFPDEEQMEQFLGEGRDYFNEDPVFDSVANEEEIERCKHVIKDKKQFAELYFKGDMTYKAIGQMVGVTESRVCQVISEIIVRAKSRLNPR